MKTLLLLACLVASALAAVNVFSPNQPPLDAVIAPVSAARSALDPSIAEGGWESAMTAFDEDSGAFRAKTLQEIEIYAQGAKTLARRCDDSRAYQQTRIKALREHADYARAELVVLPMNEYEDDFTSAHAHFYTTMRGLRDAFSQAMGELQGRE